MGKAQTERKPGFRSELCHSHPAGRALRHWQRPAVPSGSVRKVARSAGWELRTDTAMPSVSIPLLVEDHFRRGGNDFALSFLGPRPKGSGWEGTERPLCKGRLNLPASVVNALGRDTFECSAEQKDLLMPLGLLPYT